jgi:hypothetical protein
MGALTRLWMPPQILPRLFTTVLKAPVSPSVNAFQPLRTAFQQPEAMEETASQKPCQILVAPSFEELVNSRQRLRP